MEITAPSAATDGETAAGDWQSTIRKSHMCILIFSQKQCVFSGSVRQSEQMRIRQTTDSDDATVIEKPFVYLFRVETICFVSFTLLDSTRVLIYLDAYGVFFPSFECCCCCCFPHQRSLHFRFPRFTNLFEPVTRGVSTEGAGFRAAAIVSASFESPRVYLQNAVSHLGSRPHWT